MIMKFLNKLSEYFTFVFEGVGFQSPMEFFESLGRFSAWKPMLMTSTLFASFSVLLERSLGLKPLVYISFLVLIALEVWSGIRASQKKGQKIQSRKLGRMLIKMSIYTIIIGVLHQFSVGIAVPSVLGLEINIYVWIYYVVINWIIFQFLLSVLENLAEIGWTETNGLLKILHKKMSKWFSLHNNEN